MSASTLNMQPYVNPKHHSFSHPYFDYDHLLFGVISKDLVIVGTYDNRSNLKKYNGRKFSINETMLSKAIIKMGALEQEFASGNMLAADLVKLHYSLTQCVNDIVMPESDPYESSDFSRAEAAWKSLSARYGYLRARLIALEAKVSPVTAELHTKELDEIDKMLETPGQALQDIEKKFLSVFHHSSPHYLDQNSPFSKRRQALEEIINALIKKYLDEISNRLSLINTEINSAQDISTLERIIKELGKIAVQWESVRSYPRCPAYDLTTLAKDTVKTLKAEALQGFNVELDNLEERIAGAKNTTELEATYKPIADLQAKMAATYEPYEQYDLEQRVVEIMDRIRDKKQELINPMQSEPGTAAYADTGPADADAAADEPQQTWTGWFVANVSAFFASIWYVLTLPYNYFFKKGDTTDSNPASETTTAASISGSDLDPPSNGKGQYPELTTQRGMHAGRGRSLQEMAAGEVANSTSNVRPGSDRQNGMDYKAG